MSFHLPPACHEILGQIHALERAKQALTEELREADTSSRREQVTARIEHVCSRLALQKSRLEAFVKGVSSTTLTGRSTLKTSSPNAPGPYARDVAVGLNFSAWDHREVRITSFPSIPITVVTPIGVVTTTVSLCNGRGSFDRARRWIEMELSLRLGYSPNLAGDSLLNLHVTTASKLSGSGQVSLAGSGSFRGGYLDGDTCWLIVEGTVAALP